MCSVAQLYPILCDPVDCSPPGSWGFPGKNTGVVAISLSRGSSQPRNQTLVSCIYCIGKQILYHQLHLLVLCVLYTAYIFNAEVKSESGSVMSDSLKPHGLYTPWNSPGQNDRVGSHSLLLGIFPTQGLNPCLQHCRWILY